MLKLTIERIGSAAIIHCQGRIVRSEAAFRLRDAVTRQRDARVILLDLAGVEALEGGGLGMLLILQFWTRDHGIQFKVCDPPAVIRMTLERTTSVAAVEIAGLDEALSGLGRLV
jgi:anti-anti-sigma regulatory factor